MRAKCEVGTIYLSDPNKNWNHT